MRVTCLVGNGSSIVYNELLAIPALTEGIVGAFTQLAGNEAGDALAHFAAAINGNDRDDFEALLGPLDAMTHGLPALAGIAGPFAALPWVAEPAAAMSDAFRRLHRLGLGTALSLIAARAHDEGQPALDAGVGALVNGLLDAADGDLLTIGTLNYDGLLQAALPDGRAADLAHGQGAGIVELADDIQLLGWPLRNEPDFPEDRDIHLLHLHGSLGWLRVEPGEVRKFRIGDLRGVELWTKIAEGAADVDPVVVLTDRKDRLVGTDPFALAYSVFGQRLVTSQHWCVAGYSFLDRPVNALITAAVQQRRALGLPDPTILVLGFGDPDEIRVVVEHELGEEPPPVLVDGQGMPESVGGDAWHEWLQP